MADGRAVLSLPGGLRWVADHQPDEYDPPARFVDALGRDTLTSLPVRLVSSWRHEHRFEPVDDHRTRVTDRVDTPIPEKLLAPTFRYRHRQLAEDLASHRWSHTQGVRPGTVAVSGASGLIGTAVSAFLSTGGYRVIRLVRRTARCADERRWDPRSPAHDLFEGVDAVVHLAGASIAGRFTDAHKAAIRDSRIAPTRLLAECAARTANGPATFVCASAIGLYGYERGDEPLYESASPGTGFLADVVDEWEGATSAAAAAGLRVVTVRTGVVQTPRGGTLRIQRPLFWAGLGGRLGTGRQWLSWIDVDDLLDIYHRALADPQLAGPVNAVAPEPVRNAEYTRVLAGVLHRPALLPVPSLGPALLLGDQGARELATADQYVVPRRLLDGGHTPLEPRRLLKAPTRSHGGVVVTDPQHSAASLRVLVTGATGYIGGRLTPRPIGAGHRVRVLARNPGKISNVPWAPDVQVVRGDLTHGGSVALAPGDRRRLLPRPFDGRPRKFHRRGTRERAECRDRRPCSRCRGHRVPSGLHSASQDLSPHLKSRSQVGDILIDSGVPTLVLQAGVVMACSKTSPARRGRAGDHLHLPPDQRLTPCTADGSAAILPWWAR